MHDIATLGYSHKEAGATLDRLTAQGYHIIDIRLKAASKIPGYNRAEDCHRWLVSRDLQAAIPGLQVTHLLQVDHAGMIKHANARTPGRCAWAINGVACTEETYQRCARCRGELCELHAQDIYRWERQTFFCPDCLESYLDEQARY